MNMDGIGQRSAPFILPACSNREGVFGRLRHLHHWESGSGSDWRLIDWGVSEPDGGLEKIRFTRRRFTDDQVITDRVAFYYDVSAVEGAKPPICSPVVWRSEDGEVSFFQDLNWLHFDRLEDNAPEGGPMDVSLFYSALIGQAKIDMYGACDKGDTEAVKREATAAFDLARQLAPGSKAPWDAKQDGKLWGRYLLAGSDIVYVAVTSDAGRFIKVSMTFRDTEAQSREMLGESLKAINDALAGGARSWRPEDQRE